MANLPADHQCTMIPVKPNTGVVATSLEGYFCPWCEIAKLRLDLAQQAINASTIIEQQKQLRECERALHLYSGGTSEYFDRHPLRDDVGDGR